MFIICASRLICAASHALTPVFHSHLVTGPILHIPWSTMRQQQNTYHLQCSIAPHTSSSATKLHSYTQNMQKCHPDHRHSLILIKPNKNHPEPSTSWQPSQSRAGTRTSCMLAHKISHPCTLPYAKTITPANHPASQQESEAWIPFNPCSTGLYPNSQPTVPCNISVFIAESGVSLIIAAEASLEIVQESNTGLHAHFGGCASCCSKPRAVMESAW